MPESGTVVVATVLIAFRNPLGVGSNANLTEGRVIQQR